MDELKSQLMSRLSSADSEARIVVARGLADLAEPSMQLFARCLGDDDWRVRKAAVEAFFQLGQPLNFVSELIELLHHQENAGLRNSAIEILIGLGPLAVSALQQEIRCPDEEVRKFVIDILGEIGDDRCADDLIEALADKDVNVRYAAAETLGKLESTRAVPALLALMADPDPGLKFTILQSLAKIGGEIPVAALQPYLANSLLRKALFDCFARIGGAEVVPDLVRGLVDPMRNAREAALRGLGGLHATQADIIAAALAGADQARIAEYLETILKGEDHDLKEAALTLYGYVGRHHDLRALLTCIGDERLRHAALEAFELLGEESVSRLVGQGAGLSPDERLFLVFVGGELGFSGVLPLAREAVVSIDSQFRFAGGRALGCLGEEDDLERILALLDDEVPEIKDTAAEALAVFGRRYHARVIRRLAPLLTDADPKKRMRIVRVLSLIDGDEIVDLLLKAFKDPSSNVRCEAIRALQGRHSPSIHSGLTLALTDESGEVRRLAVTALGGAPKESAFPALNLAAGDADPWVRAAVMRALATFPGGEVTELLRRGMADGVGLVAIAALETATALVPDIAGQMLEQALEHSDEEVVKSAIALLGRLRGPDWIEPCQEALLNHPHWDVRVHAARVLGESKLPQARELLESRLLIEGEGMVRQALETAIRNRLGVEIEKPGR